MLVSDRCKEADERLKYLAAEYRCVSASLKKRIHKMQRDLCKLPPKATYTAKRAEIEEQLEILRQMYRTTTEIGREAGHYYEKDWWRSEVYTLNSR